MKQHRFIFGTIVTAAVILAGLSACSIDDSRLHEGLRRVSIKATIENDGPGTKVVIDDNDHGEEGDFHWNDDDALALYVVENGVAAYRITENYGASGGKDNNGIDNNKFDIYMSPDATRTGFAFYPPRLVLQNDSGKNFPVPDISLTKPQVLLPRTYLNYPTPDGQRVENYSPLPMIADNTRSDGNLNFRHLGGMIRLVFDSRVEDANYFSVAVGDLVNGEFRAYRIAGIFDVINSNSPDPDNNIVTAQDINAGNCYTKVDESDYVTGGDIWKTDSEYSIRFYASMINTLNIPVPTGHYTTVMVRCTDIDGTLLREGTYSLGPDGWTCQRRHGWKLGVNLDPSGTEYFLSEPEDVELPYSGGTASLRTDQLFKSYKTIPAQGATPATDKPVPYHLEYSEDGTNWSTTAPLWLNVTSPTSFAGSVEGEDLALTITQQDFVESADPRHTVLAGQNAKSGFDLSTVNVATGETVSRSTANCYVVQAPGTYKFPLVYGNGVSGGIANPAAYTGRGVYQGEPVEHYGLEHFVNYNDDPITSPYILTDLGLTANKFEAVVVWSDVDGLVSNAQVTDSGENAYISFDVPAASIHQGNAVIALRKKSDQTIVWSWHIWVTDRNLAQNVPAGDYYQFAPYNVGWVDGAELGTYAERFAYVRAVQESGKTSDKAKITQCSARIGERGYSPYYQWGRKDLVQPRYAYVVIHGAPLGNTVVEYRDRPYYSDSGYTLDNGIAGNPTFGTNIQNPHKRYTGYNGVQPDKGHCDNLWNTNSPEGKTYGVGLLVKFGYAVKTIYDPSPVGYQVPPYDAFYVFRNDNNFRWNAADGFNQAGRKYDNTLFFPGVGMRRVSSGSEENWEKVNGMCWSTDADSYNYAYNFYYSSSRVLSRIGDETADNANGSLKRDCLPVHPIKENLSSVNVNGEGLAGWR